MFSLYRHQSIDCSANQQAGFYTRKTFVGNKLTTGLKYCSDSSDILEVFNIYGHDRLLTDFKGACFALIVLKKTLPS